MRLRGDDLRPRLAERELALRRSRARVERAQRNRRRARRRRASAWVGLAAGSVVTGFALGSPGRAGLPPEIAPSFAVERVAVSGAVHLDPQRVATAAALPPDARLGTLERAAIAQRLEAHPWIRRARVLAVPPATLLIGIEERRAVARVRADPAAAVWWVDETALAFAPAEPKASDPPLPLLEGVAPSAGGRDPQIEGGLALLRALPVHALPAPARLRLEAASDAPPSWIVELPESRARAIVAGAGLADQLDRWARLREAGLPELEQADWIDLRFADRAVLRSETPRTGAP